MKALIILLAFAIQGCATQKAPDPLVVLSAVDNVGFETDIKSLTTSPASGKDVETPKSTVTIDKYLLEPCAPFTRMLNTNPGPRDVLVQRASDVKIHAECRARQASLVKIVRDAFNIP